MGTKHVEKLLIDDREKVKGVARLKHLCVMFIKVRRGSEEIGNRIKKKTGLSQEVSWRALD